LALDRAVKHRKEAGFVPYRCVSTIYKVKGRAFDHIVIPYVGRISFPANALGRRLMYVALSRARQTITIIVPSANPSQLLGSSW
jgi:DNA helicase-2/ATP-dependent DNA helicase PcrA